MENKVPSSHSSAPGAQLSHLSILKRTGAVLLAVGLFDIGVMVYCIYNGLSYSSSFNIFAVVAGIFLRRGSLRAASIVRWFSVLMFSAFSGLLIVWPFLQPIDLTLTRARLSPFATIASFGLIAFLLALLLWLSRELGRTSVLDARAAAGRKVRDMRVPVAIGVGCVVAVAIFLNVLLGGEMAGKARSMAQKELGSTYSYHVSSLQIGSSSTGTSVAAVVTAWNREEIKDVSITWNEP